MYVVVFYQGSHTRTHTVYVIGTDHVIYGARHACVGFPSHLD